MKRYIDKEALVALIKSYKNGFCDRNGYLEDSETNGLAYDTLCELEDSIDSLEVKEVDLEKEIDNIWNPRFNLGWDEKSLLSMNHEGFTTTAKYFFELGLKTKRV